MFRRLTSPFRAVEPTVDTDSEDDEVDHKHVDRDVKSNPGSVADPEGDADTVVARERITESESEYKQTEREVELPFLESFNGLESPGVGTPQQSSQPLNDVVLSRGEYDSLIRLASSNKKNSVSFTTKRKDLPRIEYSKLVTLSLTNFSEFRESLKNLGYSRGWPTKYSNPTLSDLRECKWDGVDREESDDILRREAYLIIYQLVTASLKYLLKGVQSGDVLGVWVVLYKRFLRVTEMAIKTLKKEWECLSMDTSHLRLDEFISLVSTKAENLRMVGETIDDSSEASALLCGLSEKFEWLKRYFSLQESYTFNQVATEALKYATDKQLLSTGSKGSGATENEDKTFCLAFNTTTCVRKGCKFPHRKVSAKAISALKAKIAEKKKARGVEPPDSKMIGFTKGDTQKKPNQGERKGSCFKCGSADHYSNTCPLKDKIDTYIKTLKGGGSHQFPVILFSECKQQLGWVLDGGAGEHVTNNLQDLKNVRVVPPDTVVFTVGNNQVMIPSHVGDAKVNAVLLTRVYFCRDCPVKLMSEPRLLLAGADIKKCSVKREAVVSKGNLIVMRAPLNASMFVVTHAVDSTDELQIVRECCDVDGVTPLVSAPYSQ